MSPRFSDSEPEMRQTSAKIATALKIIVSRKPPSLTNVDTTDTTWRTMSTAPMVRQPVSRDRPQQQQDVRRLMVVQARGMVMRD